MTRKTIAIAIATLSIIATPTLAYAAPANPAASLSIAPAARAGSTTVRKNHLAGGFLVPLLIAAGIVAIVAVGVTQTDRSASN